MKIIFSKKKLFLVSVAFILTSCMAYAMEEKEQKSSTGKSFEELQNRHEALFAELLYRLFQTQKINFEELKDLIGKQKNNDTKALSLLKKLEKRSIKDHRVIEKSSILLGDCSKKIEQLTALVALQQEHIAQLQKSLKSQQNNPKIKKSSQVKNKAKNKEKSQTKKKKKLRLKLLKPQESEKEFMLKKILADAHSDGDSSNGEPAELLVDPGNQSPTAKPSPRFSSEEIAMMQDRFQLQKKET